MMTMREYLIEIHHCKTLRRYTSVMMEIQLIFTLIVVCCYLDEFLTLFQDTVARCFCIGVWWLSVIILGHYHMEANHRLDEIKGALGHQGALYHRQHGKFPPKKWLPDHIDL